MNGNNQPVQKNNLDYVRRDLRKLILVLLAIVVFLIVIKIVDDKTGFLMKLAQIIAIKK
ncbi:MAG: hypothetical protein PHV78_02820 [Patescibacteria group bacterium]|nr:hypothetical protein [Patescibacteria group bacterium]MDD5121682.1 hypothetical protein [Patescibacteria group bacterium]MDD5222083.1 hypothetical protein [Patescibacteria group bacterium]MDD5396154.1 hypothetical protein [Patescibacteria group bacterium]